MTDAPSSTPPAVAVIGAGPAGLMAAERLAASGLTVAVHERMPSVARKFLMAGRGGLNLTHSEPIEAFLNRYGEARAQVAPWLSLRPNLQYVIRPGGTGEIPDAFVVGLYTRVTF